MKRRRTILSKEVVSSWLRQKMEVKYVITVHPLEGAYFPEKLVRSLKDNGWELSFIDRKMVISSNDPIALAKLMNKLSKKGYFITE